MRRIFIVIIIIISGCLACTEETYVEGLSVDSDPLIPDSEETTFIVNRNLKNYWRNTFISPQEPIAYLSAEGYQWRIEKVNATGSFLIVDANQAPSKYLSYSNGVFSLVADISPMSSWKFEEVNSGDSSLIRIKNVGTGGYLNTEAAPSLSCGNILPGWLSAMWTN